jgi:hypothetical protein
MKRLTSGFALRLAALAVALVVGPVTLAPGTAEAPVTSALAGDDVTAAQRYGWRTMQWDYAWEFGEDFDSPAYRGANTRGGKWLDYSNGSGRVVKLGGGIEFHTGERYAGSRDRGDTRLTLTGKAARFGRWELKERTRLKEEVKGRFSTFLVELVPEGTGPEECPAYRLTLARTVLGAPTIKIGVNAGAKAWTRTLTGYGRTGTTLPPRLYAVQIAKRRITWFVNGHAVASTRARAARPKVPLTLRMSVVSEGDLEMNKADVLIDWVRNYNLKKGTRTPRRYALGRGSPGGC